MSDKPLPNGWRACQREAPASDAGTPEDEWESTASPQHPRKQLYIWERGERHVRVCYLVNEEKETDIHYYVHYGRGDRDKWWKGVDSLSRALVLARTLMRMGGKP